MVPACDGTIAGWRGHARLQRSIQRVCSPGCLFVLCPDDLVVAPDTADAIDVQTQRTSLGSLVHSHGRPLRSKRDHDGEGRLSRKKKEKGKKKASTGQRSDPVLRGGDLTDPRQTQPTTPVLMLGVSYRALRAYYRENVREVAIPSWAHHDSGGWRI